MNELETVLSPLARTGQGTEVEKSRAVAEVQAAAVLAKQSPRDVQASVRMMEDSCGLLQLAERAFFRFPRGGTQINGASVHLARELARCWGNITYGIKELRRDDNYGQSEMLAFAWDLEANTRAETTFIVPHRRDKKSGPEALIDVRDIYENNANHGARRLRECIFEILPPWFKEDAIERCRQTLEKGGGKPIERRKADCIGAFETIGVSQEDLEEKVAKKAAAWTGGDIATLGVIYQSIKRAEVKVEDEFPNRDRVTGEQIQQQGSPANGLLIHQPRPEKIEDWEKWWEGCQDALKAFEPKDVQAFQTGVRPALEYFDSERPDLKEAVTNKLIQLAVGNTGEAKRTDDAKSH